MAALCTALLVLAGCGDDDNGPEATTTSIAAGPTSTSPVVTTSPVGTTSSSTSGQVVEVTFRAGSVEGPSQVEAKVGDTLTVRVTSDVAEEVHVHTFDLHAELEPGVAGEITFTTDIPGRHEVELEDSGKRLFTLVVQA